MNEKIVYDLLPRTLKWKMSRITEYEGDWISWNTTFYKIRLNNLSCSVWNVAIKQGYKTILFVKEHNDINPVKKL